MDIFFFGHFIPVEYLFLGFVGLTLLVIAILGYFNYVDDEIKGDFRTRQALFHHSAHMRKRPEDEDTAHGRE